MNDSNELQETQLSKDEKNWGVYCHLASLLGFLIPAFGNFIGPLVVWLMKKDEYPMVEDQGKEVLNFQITLLLISIVAGLLVAVLIGMVVLWILPFYWLILTIIGAVKASDGVRYRYPFTLRLIK
ncbi:MAG: DUF4870 domain-containing protein [Pseudomonadales bacterium]|nr:DUF4870 domain-containing protein [Pseudomonadales bacterium]